MARITLVGIPIDAITASEAIDQLKTMLAEPRFHHVTTPNNEMLVEASRNPEFRSVLQKSDLNLPDSTGLLFAARMTGQQLPERVTGVDTVMKLCGSLSSDHPVFLLGAKEGIAERAADALRKMNPNLKIAGTFAGSPSDAEAEQIISRINAAAPHLLLVAYGAPKQDLWIAKYKDQLSSVRVAMGIGGTFDFLAGTVKRAPGWMRSIGLEWLWRLFQEPRRAGRIFTALIIFPLMILLYRKKSDRLNEVVKQ